MSLVGSPTTSLKAPQELANGGAKSQWTYQNQNHWASRTVRMSYFLPFGRRVPSLFHVIAFKVKIVLTYALLKFAFDLEKTLKFIVFQVSRFSTRGWLQRETRFQISIPSNSLHAINLGSQLTVGSNLRTLTGGVVSFTRGNEAPMSSNELVKFEE